jgi:hypothetical protein
MVRSSQQVDGQNTHKNRTRNKRQLSYFICLSDVLITAYFGGLEIIRDIAKLHEILIKCGI